MANIYWPQLLPSGLLAEGFTKKPQSGVIRTRMDAGPQKTRRRYTARAVKYTGRQVFDAAELAVFEQFYHTVLADGVLRFNFEDPVTTEAAEFRFTDDYNVSESEGYFVVTIDGAVLRFADNNQNITSRGNDFIAAGFTIILPEQTDNAPRPCKLAIDNTDLAVFQTIKQAAGRDVTVTVCVVMADTPDIYERGPLKYRLRNVRATQETIEGEIYDFYLSDRKFPKDTYTPEDFEGLFY